jgi:hypothetical protein
MAKYSNELRDKLSRLIERMKSSPADFFKNPGRDFTRERKLPFCEMVRLIIAIGGSSICNELLKAKGYSEETPTTSAFIQQRSKILPCAFEYLFREFTKECLEPETFRGYRLFAVDGSTLSIAPTAADDGTYVPKESGKTGFYALHMNAVYDLLSRVYVDALIQPRKQENENRAMADMIDRSKTDGKVIVIADRAYESCNIFAHAEQKGWKYLIRVKDVNSSGILSRIKLPQKAEFDVTVNRILTRRQTKEVKSNPDIYRFLPANVNFDYLTKQVNKHIDEVYPMTFRVVRFKVTDDLYETVITNLDENEFTPDDLKELYRMRWGIETSFRDLKYTIGLTSFHAKKRDFISQEVFARLLMYNFTEMVTSHVVISQADRKLTYQVNFTVAVIVCKRFLKSLSCETPPNVEALIRKNILPVRPGRNDKRKIRPKPAVSFLYRVA